MRLKLIKKFNIAYIIYSIIMAIALLLCLFKMEEIKSFVVYVFIGIVVFSLIFISIYHYLEVNVDRKIITKMVQEGNMALARIESGVFEKIHKDAALKKYVIWKLSVTIYDKNLEVHKMEIYDQFAPQQESIPQGNVYVTYDPNKPDCIFIIPNMLVGAFESNKDLILNYEKKIKNIKYLNVYYNHGLVVETFKESMKKKQEEYEARKALSEDSEE